MGNFCTSDDRILIEFVKFYKENHDFIITDADLINKIEKRNKKFLVSLLNKNRDIALEKMSNY